MEKLVLICYFEEYEPCEIYGPFASEDEVRAFAGADPRVRVAAAWTVHELRDPGNRAELLREQATLRALSWKDSRVTARLETLHTLLNETKE